MKRLDRYIIRELIVPFLAGSIAIALLFDINQLIFLLKTLNTQSTPPIAMLQMIIYRTPAWLNLTLPAGIALAGSLAITRLARESEITAMRAVGTRVIRIILPVIMFGVVVSIGNFYLVEKIMPRSEKRANQIQTEIGLNNSTPTFNSNVWLNLREYRATFAGVRRLSSGAIELQDIVLGLRPSGKTVTFFSAPTGVYENGIWTMQDAKQWDISADSNKTTVYKIGKITINQTIITDDLFEQPTPETKTLAQLAQTIRTGKQQGRNMTKEEVYYHTRFSVPAACIIFAIIAPIFAVTFARSGSFVGVLLSIILVMLYYNAYVISTEIFGKNQWMPPVLAAWLPNIIFLSMGLLAIRRIE